MIYSAACEYAIRAATHLARHPDGHFVKARDISDVEEIPAPFLSSVLQRLVAADILESARGPGGGYRLTRPANQISLYDIKAAVDGVEELNACAVGLAACSDEMPCPLHDTWKPIRERIHDYLMRTTLEKMAEAVASKRAD